MENESKKEPGVKPNMRTRLIVYRATGGKHIRSILESLTNYNYIDRGGNLTIEGKTFLQILKIRNKAGKL